MHTQMVYQMVSVFQTLRPARCWRPCSARSFFRLAATAAALVTLISPVKAALIGVVITSNAGAIAGTSSNNHIGHTTAIEPGQTLYLTPDTVTSSGSAAGGGAQTTATGSMGVLRAFATASWAGWMQATSGGGAGGAAGAEAWDTLQVQNDGPMEFVIQATGTSTGDQGSNIDGGLGGATGFASLTLYNNEFQTQTLLSLLYDPNGNSNVLSGTVDLVADQVYYVTYGVYAQADIYSNFLDQGSRSGTADFSHTLRVQLIPQAAGLGLSSGSGFDYVNVAAAPEPASLALLGAGLAGIALNRRRSAIHRRR